MNVIHLSITTPMSLLVNEPAILAVRAEDTSGSFGILPGHTDFLTVLPASVLSWRTQDEALHYCALRGGLLTVTNGNRVAVACREGIIGDDLRMLEAEVTHLRETEADQNRCARVEQMRLHSAAVRHLISILQPRRFSGLAHPPASAQNAMGNRNG
ncbi:F0F1 ATP synthase subunit epsilon [uncultured Cohaesibacter sp.]|uniref:F0F1 ATP synthase subunit epsilon n=1 Tax=uncultured Cohaesibacter sp. TaxID=1002546 RepID=UPI0029C89A41|nr:F0F1 ATP synthase subunit epsilon [uncultured Cohaesibacter sp.]